MTNENLLDIFGTTEDGRAKPINAYVQEYFSPVCYPLITAPCARATVVAGAQSAVNHVTLLIPFIGAVRSL